LIKVTKFLHTVALIGGLIIIQSRNSPDNKPLILAIRGAVTNQQFPLVTIGIPTYNRADGYLRETLESALAQTYPNLEIVVADNCSPDNTKTVIESDNDARIQYFRHEHGLIPNDNFNFCLSQARGSYFLLLHDDDKIDPDYIDTCLAAANYNTHFGVIRTAVRMINSRGAVMFERRNKVSGLSTGEWILAWFAGRCSIYLCGTLFNTQALKGISGFHSRHNLFQDVMTTAKLAARHGRLDIETIKASARQHSAKWTHVARVNDWCEDSLDLLQLLCELAPEHAEEIRARGMKYFAMTNYNRASAIRTPIKRLKAYALVYRAFEKRYPLPVRTAFRSTSLYRGLRNIKRKMMGLPAWAD
jgi:glycosyltransferase involved in cell wall biosynthesis